MDTIPAKELDWYVNKKGYLIVDLRPYVEFEKGHIRGAVNVPEGRFGAWLRSSNRKEILILYCDRGAMSMSVARSLEEKGFRTKTVVGGIRAYRGGNLVR
ncbi:MAG: rhodanese-like domain-containing protein [Lachnospiraceae bacterium]|nr:rhodanese-like domain-containing protein [Lachnospiraceae bacterium]MCD7766289.1 rhodanese-like domain-containing protein [Lachnospiraceae bacterium]